MTSDHNQSSTFILLRHGEPSDSLLSEKIFRGITDNTLTKKGWQQMSDAVSKHASIEKLDHIISSPLKRCYDFSESLSTKHSLPLKIISALKEIDFGQWDGQTVQSVKDNDGDRLDKFWQDPLNNTPPDGEPVLAFQTRVVACWNELLMKHRGKNCLLVSHGGVQKMILAEILKMPIHTIHNIEVPYACCTTLQVYYNGPKFLVTLKSHINL